MKEEGFQNGGPRVRLEATGLRIGRGERLLVHGADLVLESGSVVWVEGDSGAGKSTLLRSLARLLPIEAGRIRLGGRDAATFSPHIWRSRVTLAPHPPLVVGETVGEDLLAPHRLGVRKGRTVPSVDVFHYELEGVGLGGLGLDHPTRELSQGQAARLAFLRALLAGPEVLLLDEPTANLDPRSSGRVAARVRAFAETGGAVCVAGHTDPWEGVTRRMRIDSGRLLEVSS